MHTIQSSLRLFKVNDDVQKTFESPEYNRTKGHNELKMQVPEKRDTLSKKLYLFPGYTRQLSSAPEQHQEEESRDAPPDVKIKDTTEQRRKEDRLDAPADVKIKDTKICTIQ